MQIWDEKLDPINHLILLTSPPYYQIDVLQLALIITISVSYHQR